MIRRATPDDLDPLHALVQRAYRGDAARAGWTYESDLVEGERIDRAALAALIDTPGEHLLVAEQDGRLVGCVQVSDRGQVGYFGLLAVDPGLQSAGLGGRIVAAAEDAARGFGARTMELSVLEQRASLIAWYERRGYAATGERRPFPVAAYPHYRLRVFAKPL